MRKLLSLVRRRSVYVDIVLESRHRVYAEHNFVF